MLRIGLVDCDTSHVVAFTQRLNHVGIGEEHWVEGARVVAAVPGTSAVSPERIAGFVDQLRGHGIEIVGRPEELVGKVDAVMVESADGGVHLERARPFVEAGLPLFVDKPFTTSVAEARELVEAARRRGVPLMSASALRYCPEVLAVRRRAEELGAVLGVDAYTPATLHRRNPGLFHYGVHGVETVYALMGTGCRSVRCVFEEGAEVVVGRWGDGRLGTVRGTRRGGYAMGFTCFCEKGVAPAQVNVGQLYRDLLVEVVGMFRTGRWPLGPEELIEPVAFQEAALGSKERGGEEVALAVL
ncbi:MAG TPA: Gfo/Idh/MocA family oxidoreductase [Chloroflexota bacterium]|jgi:predicted dehydrogenase|nr:Gfo/Idh/MocA family oxidoreductase [Chloroflexota bacterium]